MCVLVTVLGIFIYLYVGRNSDKYWDEVHEKWEREYIDSEHRREFIDKALEDN